MKSPLGRTALPCVLLAGTALCALAAAPAHAQATARQHRAPDANGVDLTWGDYLMRFTEGSIGAGEAELALVRTGVRTGTAENGHEWDGVLFVQDRSSGVEKNNVFLGPVVETFAGAASSPRGSVLSGGGGSYTYTRSDGTSIEFSDISASSGSGSNLCNGSADQVHCSLLPTSVSSPNGNTVSIEHDLRSYCTAVMVLDQEPNCTYYSRISRISNGYGYSIGFTYASNGGGTTAPPPADWFRRTGAAFYNSNVSAGTPQASVSYSYPSSGVTEVTDMGGNQWRFTGTVNGVTSIRRPGASSATTTIGYASGSNVSSVTNEGVTTGYSRSVSGSTATMTVTNALGQVSTIVSDLAVGRPTSATDPLGRTTSWQYDSHGRLTRTTAPEGNYVQLGYDSRGNVTQSQAVAKPGSGAAAITTSATYASSCSVDPACNSPLTTTDARGNITDYSYDSTHGGLLTVTAPAPASGAARPQTRYGYTLTNGEYRLTSVSQCQTGASCAGTADEVKSAIAYDSNGNVISASVGSGNGALTAATAMTYDAMGNLVTVDGPLSGSADTVRYRYNSARQPVGTISPDPDGGGALKHRASRNTYANGLLVKVENGTVNSQSDGDWAAMSVLEAVETAYDGHARPVTAKLVAGGSVQALTQTSYDALGRPECAATRMNPAAFGALPSSACSLGAQGSHGPDRISKTVYDAAGQVTQVKSAVGTALEAADVATTYTLNGKAATVTDGENNKTSYEYDGHDRLAKTYFPSATKGAGTSNGADYEQLSYDAGGNVTSRRLRDGNSVGYGYDALGRLVSKTRPNSEGNATYGYDNLGRMTSNVDLGKTLSFTWDALGRRTSEVNRWGTVSSTWDVAGRRTRLTHPDGFYVDYDHLVTGETSAVRENGAASGVGVLATYAYDDLGRRTTLTRGNGSVKSYAYDGASRLASLGEDLAGTGADLTQSFTYNPASQIATATRSNDAYAWSAHYNLTRSYGSNGLNQYTASGPVTPTYDARGNLTSAGATTYGYNSDNLLTHKNGADIANYDGLLRLSRLGSAGQPATKFNYDGADLIGEYDGAIAGVSLLRRYVHGPAADEPLVWYEGSGTSDRRFLHSDERGSVIATSNSSGTTLSTNTYDESGIPGSGNSGRFQYTGQTWLPELGMYYYKARLYSPTLGRFLQTDPIGYGDGMNMYAYVSGDPVNFTDPLGLNGCGLSNNAPEIMVCGRRESGGASNEGGIGVGMGAPHRFQLAALVEASDSGSGENVDSGDGRGSCPVPTSVHLSGKLSIGAAMHATASFSGSLKDVNSGRELSIRTRIPATGGGLAGGIYEVTGTLRGGLDALDAGFNLSFWTIGYGPFSFGGASISNVHGSLGEVSVNGMLSTPIGAGGVSFNPEYLRIAVKKEGQCPPGAGAP